MVVRVRHWPRSCRPYGLDDDEALPEPAAVGGVIKTMKIRVLLCFQPHIRALATLVHELLNRAPDTEVHDHCHITEVPRLADTFHPHAVLVVVGTPRADDVQALTEAAVRFPGASIIALSLAADLPIYVKPLEDAGVCILVDAMDVGKLAEIVRQAVTSSGRPEGGDGQAATAVIGG